MTEPWSIQLFGALRARQGERVITRFRSQQTGALLAYLAYHRQHSHTREMLIDLFWPESDYAAGRHNLCNALSSLRNQLEPPGEPTGSVIIADRFSVELNPEAVTTDVDRFDQALRRAALARLAPNYVTQLAECADLYGGPLLPQSYYEWIPPEQERLKVRYGQTVSQLVELLEKEGRYESALDYAGRALSLDPLDELATKDVMRLMAAAGQHESALALYHDLERVLAEQLGTAPSSSAQQLARRIEEQMSSAPAVPPASPAPRPVPLASPHAEWPAGTVTFLLSDIEDVFSLIAGSPDAFRSALAVYQALIRSEFRRNGGIEVKEAGGSFVAAFASATDALTCGIAFQRALASQLLPVDLSVRIALTTDDVELDDGEYQSSVLSKAAALLDATNGGQMLASESTAVLLRRNLEPGMRLKDLGIWRLRDAAAPERLFQVDTPRSENRDFPPPNATPAHAARLPMQFTRFFGRTEEIERISGLLHSGDSRLITLTGSGGTGKTRLAIEAADRFASGFQGSIWFVPLADISDPTLLMGAILDAVGVPRGSAEEPMAQAAAALSKQPSLLLLDNFEQLVEGGAEILQALRERVPGLQLLVTSRQSLGLPGEQEVPVVPLTTPGDPQVAATPLHPPLAGGSTLAFI